MPIYRVAIIAKSIETYEVEAEDAEAAEERFAHDGRLVTTDEDVENEIMEVTAI